MTRRIFINDNHKQDNILILNIDPYFIVITNRTDLPKIKSLDEGNKPGLYILMYKDKIYIGQASEKIFSRLKQHDINKKWWNKVIFFGREDGHIDKSQTDYLKSNLIKKFHAFNFQLENNSKGNNSYIDKIRQDYADKLMSTVEDTLTKYTSINLFDNNTIKLSNNKVQNNKYYVNFLNQTFNGKSCRQIFINIVIYILNNTNIEKLDPIISNDIPNTKLFLGYKPRISNKGAKLTKLVNKQYHLYVNFSKLAIKNRLLYLSNLLNCKVYINF